MHYKVHYFALAELVPSVNAMLEPMQVWSRYASASKPTHKAGRRGGESIARQRWCVIIKIIVRARRDGTVVVVVGSLAVLCGRARVVRLRGDGNGYEKAALMAA